MPTRNNGRFTSESGRLAAQKQRLPEPTVKTQVVLFKRQQEWLNNANINRSDLIRTLLDQHITRNEGD